MLRYKIDLDTIVDNNENLGEDNDFDPDEDFI
jgi:hypothetical protein